MEKINNLTPNERFYIVILFGVFISLVEAYYQYSLKSRRFSIGII